MAHILISQIYSTFLIDKIRHRITLKDSYHSLNLRVLNIFMSCQRRRIIIQNVNYKADEESLEKHFMQAGLIEKVIISKMPNQKSKGIAYVTYENTEGARNAIKKFNGTIFMNNQLYIRFYDLEESENENDISNKSSKKNENNWFCRGLISNPFRRSNTDKHAESNRTTYNFSILQFFKIL